MGPYDPLPSEARSTQTRILTVYPELREWVRSAPEWNAELAIEARGPQLSEDTGPTIIPGQLMSVEVLGEPEFTGRWTVDVDGSIEYPLLGRIVAAGRAREEVKEELRRRLRKYLADPQVIVNLGRVG